MMKRILAEMVNLIVSLELLFESLVMTFLANSSFWRKLKFSFMFSQDFQRQLSEAPLISNSIFLIIPESSHLTCLFNAERSTSILKNFADRTRTMTYFWKVGLCLFTITFFNFTLSLLVQFMWSQVRYNLGGVSFETLSISMDWEEILLRLPYTGLRRTSSGFGEIDRTVLKEARPYGVILFSIRFCQWVQKSSFHLNLDLTLTRLFLFIICF